MRALFGHGYAIEKQRCCSGRAQTPAAERLGGRPDGRRDERLSGGALRRPLQPQAASYATTGFAATKTPRPRHGHRDEQPGVH